MSMDHYTRSGRLHWSDPPRTVHVVAGFISVDMHGAPCTIQCNYFNHLHRCAPGASHLDLACRGFDLGYAPNWFRSRGSRRCLSACPRRALSIARVKRLGVMTKLGKSRCRTERRGLAKGSSQRIQGVLGRKLRGGTRPPRRIIVARPNDMASKAFSVRPFTRAHIERPLPVLSVPAPDT